MKNIAFIVASVLTLTLTALVSAETVVAPRPAQVVLQFSQTIPPEPSVAPTHQHGTPAKAGGCCEKKEMKQKMQTQAGKAGCCCSNK